MKKKNIITLLCLVALIIAVFAVAVFKKSNPKDTQSSPSQSEQSGTAETSSVPTDDSMPSESEPSKEVNTDISIKDSLFIGDSRTVGLMEYAGLSDADFFCNVGMSVYNIDKKPVSVPNVGKVSFTELISEKKYGKIYIMLGVNEIGYETKTTLSKYSELISLIMKNQPDATVFIEANLHVSKTRSDRDQTVNNAAIDRLNAELKKLADGKTVFYLDANTVFDDGTGNLPSDKTEDGTHLYAKYYAEWGRWIIEQTASLVGEG